MRVFVLLAVTLVIATAAPAPRIDLDFSGDRTGHALITLGFATIKLAFDFGH
jgi:hypothetical protein